MKNKVIKILFIITLLIFIGSVSYIGISLFQYAQSRKIYDEARDSFISIDTEIGNQVGTSGSQDNADGSEMLIDGNHDTAGQYVSDAFNGKCPITVDFDALTKVNSDIIGWIYCEDSVINYPILQSEDNDFYLHRTYDKRNSSSGSIFAEKLNTGTFEDANTILYGHHMKDGSMFASISKWGQQEYYERHPYMWILTPTKTYKMLLVSGFYTDALSDVYAVYNSHGEYFVDYIEKAVKKSGFKTKETVDPKKNFVILSTCEYRFENARYVLFGMLEEYNEE